MQGDNLTEEDIYQNRETTPAFERACARIASDVAAGDASHADARQALCIFSATRLRCRAGVATPADST
jgi:hypothetical protein